MDALLTDLGEVFLVETLTEKGYSLFLGLREAQQQMTEVAQRVQQQAYDKMPVAFETEGLKAKLERILTVVLARSIAELPWLRCLYFPVPTCFCFDIADETQRRERVRNWDTCMFRTYSLEASGHNPRPSKGNAPVSA